jgi:hypothetical protein
VTGDIEHRQKTIPQSHNNLRYLQISCPFPKQPYTWEMGSFTALVVVVMACFLRISATSAFTGLLKRQARSSRAFAPFSGQHPSVRHAHRDEHSSYDIDSDAESEQRLAEKNVLHDNAASSVVVNANGGGNGNEEINKAASGGRYGSLLSAVGLSDQVSEVISHIPVKRPVSHNDVFCNRELKLSAIRAVGFDMDYTLAQYQQPAFDQLAFDGAKEKLFSALGDPKEVLDFKYDHTVSFFICDFIFLSSLLVNYHNRWPYCFLFVSPVNFLVLDKGSHY